MCVCAFTICCTEALLWRAALTRAKQLVVVVGTWDALRIAVESERSDQRMSTLQHRITNLAVAAGATPNQRMHSFEAKPPPVQQQARGAPGNPPGPQTTATPQIPSAAPPQRRPERVATYASANASYAQMQQQQQQQQRRRQQQQQQRLEHYQAAHAGPGRANEAR